MIVTITPPDLDMRQFPSDKISKAAFLVSVALLMFLYGYATRGFGWFPSDLLDRAYRAKGDAIALLTGTPTYVSSRVYNKQGVRVEEPGKIQPGLTLVSSLWSEFNWNAGVKLIARNGQTVHSWQIDETKLFPDALGPLAGRLKSSPVHGTHLFSNGDLLVNVQNVGTVRLDACGKVLWRLQAKSHHSIAVAEDGSLWIPARTTNGRNTSEKVQGAGLEESWDHRILHVSQAGEILEEIDVLKVLFANELQRHIGKAYRWKLVEGDPIGDDVTHLNDVEPLRAELAGQYPLFEEGDLLVSLRNIDLVFVMDPRSERVKWHSSHPFLQQHDPDFIGGGWIGVLDNNRDGSRRGSFLGGSRLVAVQPHTGSTKVLFPKSRSLSFYTDVMGKWQLLENGNYLFTESQAGRVVEVTTKGHKVWEWTAEHYRTEEVAMVLEGTRYDLRPEQVTNWPCTQKQAREDVK